MRVKNLFFKIFNLFIFYFITSHLSLTAAAKPKIALVIQYENNQFFLDMQKAAKQFAQKNNNFELIIKGVQNDSDHEGQVKIIHDLLQEEPLVKALLITPIDSVKIIPALVSARNKGVIVVNLDNRINQEALTAQKITPIPFVGPNNFNAAYEVGKSLAQTLTKGDQAAIITGVPHSQNSELRSNGFRKSLQENGLVIVATANGNWDEKKSAEEATKILEKYPELKALLCANDHMAIGAIQALKKSGKSTQVKVIGFDNIRKVKPLLGTKQLYATVDQHPEKQVVTALELSLDLIQNKKTQINPATHSIEILTEVVK